MTRGGGIEGVRLGGLEAGEVDDKAGREAAAPYGARLTVREIRGLLTRIGAELLKTAGAGPQPNAEPFRLIDPGKFVEQMKPFLRMN